MEAANGSAPAPEPPMTPGQIGDLSDENRTGPAEPARGSIHGRESGGLQGPERGVYGPEHGVYGRSDSTQAAGTAQSGPLPTPGQIGDDNSLDGQKQNRGTIHGQESGRAAQERDDAATGPLPTPGEIADDRAVAGPLGQNVEVAERVAPIPGGWTEYEAQREQRKEDGNAGTDQNERARGRSLPDEQQEQDRGRGR
jgi:hypothetical protein